MKLSIGRGLSVRYIMVCVLREHARANGMPLGDFCPVQLVLAKDYMGNRRDEQRAQKYI